MYSRFSSRSKKKASQVMCWFCNNNCEISKHFSYSGGWNCPSCEHHNSFDTSKTKDSEHHNYVFTCESDGLLMKNRKNNNLNYAAPGKFTGQSSLTSQPQLCGTCCRKQTEKIQKLNSFEPSNKELFREEYEMYKQHIENQFSLCMDCKQLLQDHLRTQEKEMRMVMCERQLHHFKNAPPKNRVGLTRTVKVTKGILVLQLLSALTLSLVLYGESCNGSCAVQLKASLSPLFPRNESNSPTFQLLFAKVVSFKNFWKSFDDEKLDYVPVLFEIRILLHWMSMLCQKTASLLQSLSEAYFKHLSLVTAALLLQLITFTKLPTRIGIAGLVLSSVLFGTFVWEFVLRSLVAPSIKICLSAISWLISVIILLYIFVHHFRRTRSRKNFHLLERRGDSSRSLSNCTLSTPAARRSSSMKWSDDEDNDEESGALKSLDAMFIGSSRNSKSNTSRLNGTSPGTFWSPGVLQASTPGNITLESPSSSPLVAMGQRPLIIPATFSPSGHHHKNNVFGNRHHQLVDESMDSADEEDYEKSHSSVSNSRRMGHMTLPRELSFLIKLLAFLFTCSLLVNILLLVLVIILTAKS